MNGGHAAMTLPLFELYERRKNLLPSLFDWLPNETYFIPSRLVISGKDHHIFALTPHPNPEIDFSFDMSTRHSAVTFTHSKCE